jgi:hypothetical protein
VLAGFEPHNRDAYPYFLVHADGDSEDLTDQELLKVLEGQGLLTDRNEDTIRSCFTGCTAGVVGADCGGPETDDVRLSGGNVGGGNGVRGGGDVLGGVCSGGDTSIGGSGGAGMDVSNDGAEVHVHGLSMPNAGFKLKEAQIWLSQELITQADYDGFKRVILARVNMGLG